MKRFLCAGEGYALSKPKLNSYLTLAIRINHRQNGLIAIFLSLLSMFIQAAQANITAPASPTGRAVFSPVYEPAVQNVPPDSIKPLKIGDTVPDALWNIQLNLWTAATNTSKSVTLNDYRGKVIILDFWATWCSPCIFSLRQQYDLLPVVGEGVVLIPVTSENPDFLHKFISRSNSRDLKSIGPKLQSITGANPLRSFFPSSTIPHIAIIGPAGKVSAITLPKYVTGEYLLSLLDNAPTYIPERRYGLDELPHLLSFSSGESLTSHKPVYYTTLMGEIDAYSQPKATRIDSARQMARVLLTNNTIVAMYQAGRYFEDRPDGFSFASDGAANRRILEVRDPRLYTYYFDKKTGQRTVTDPEWLRSHRYTYERIMPLHAYPNYQKTLVDDLNEFFNLHGRIEPRTVPVLILRTNSRFDVAEHQLPKEKFGFVINGTRSSRLEPSVFVGPNRNGYDSYFSNYSITNVVQGIQSIYSTHLRNLGLLLPKVIDETGLSKDIRVSLGFPDHVGVTLEDVQAALRKQGFDLVEGEREMDMFILTEPGFETKAGDRLVLTQFGFLPSSNLKFIED